ncbi:MAG: hypothetical protein QXF15_00470 [Candidatus Aenigmatarchaeota archaeon]
MIVKILSLIDILVGVCIFNPEIFKNAIIYIGIFIFLKGVYSIICSISSNYFFDWMGIIDLISGIIIFTILIGYSSIIQGIITFFWMFPILKGIYSFITTI